MGQTPLPTAVLGRTGLEVTRLGYGTSPRKHPDDQQWGRLLNGVLDSGINFIDTANDYGVGEASGPAEEQIGRHIQTRRSEYYLATKCGCAPGGGHTWTRENAFRGLEESLERLKTFDDATLIVPAHGLSDPRPVEKLQEHIDHRLWREAKIKEAYEAGAASLDALLAKAYDDVPNEALRLAEHALKAHLTRLGVTPDE